jgi:hypothetical protein
MLNTAGVVAAVQPEIESALNRTSTRGAVPERAGHRLQARLTKAARNTTWEPDGDRRECS